MKVNYFFAVGILILVVVISSCRRESITDRMAVLSMNIDGVPFTSDKASSFINASNNSLMFSNESNNGTQHAISVISFIGNELNTDYSININTISSATGSTLSQFMFVRNGNAFDQFSFPIISEKGYLNYRVVKKHTINGVDKFDVNFNGVIYASETDSVVITNGSIRY